MKADWEKEIERLGESERTEEAYTAFSIRWKKENEGQEPLVQDVLARLEREKKEEMEKEREREEKEKMEKEKMEKERITRENTNFSMERAAMVARDRRNRPWLL